jgi:hypothetical protein
MLLEDQYPVSLGHASLRMYVSGSKKMMPTKQTPAKTSDRIRVVLA